MFDFCDLFGVSIDKNFFSLFGNHRFSNGGGG